MSSSKQGQREMRKTDVLASGHRLNGTQRFVGSWVQVEQEESRLGKNVGDDGPFQAGQKSHKERGRAAGSQAQNQEKNGNSREVLDSSSSTGCLSLPVGPGIIMGMNLGILYVSLLGQLGANKQMIYPGELCTTPRHSSLRKPVSGSQTLAVHWNHLWSLQNTDKWILSLTKF